MSLRNFFISIKIISIIISTGSVLYRRALITKTPDRVRLGKHMFRVQAVSIEPLLLLGAKENRTLQGKVDKMKFLASTK